MVVLAYSEISLYLLYCYICCLNFQTELFSLCQTLCLGHFLKYCNYNLAFLHMYFHFAYMYALHNKFLLTSGQCSLIWQWKSFIDINPKQTTGPPPLSGHGISATSKLTDSGHSQSFCSFC